MMIVAKKGNLWSTRLKRLRKKRALTSEKLAEMIAVSPRTLYYYELGRQIPSAAVQRLIELAEKNVI